MRSTGLVEPANKALRSIGGTKRLPRLARPETAHENLVNILKLNLIISCGIDRRGLNLVPLRWGGPRGLGGHDSRLIIN